MEFFTAGLLLIGVLGVFRGVQDNHVVVENVDKGVGLTKIWEDFYLMNMFCRLSLLPS
ncbi:hypothetical protein [Chryseobacterium indoltheticum]|uniref:hypothetical protein n=1 Tax=Chryseobacterium indoltheticum TaxID=254 RepID=UPI003F491D9E